MYEIKVTFATVLAVVSWWAMANIVTVRLRLAGSRVLTRIAQAQVAFCPEVHYVFS